jgi:N-acetyltransferase 10
LAYQAQAVLTFVEAVKEKTLSSTVTLTAARGRGKSAALGLAVAAAVAHGYSSIFITSPSPENLKTFWQFVGDGMKALGYVINVDYDAMESTNPEFKHVIVRVNIYKTHRQTIQVLFSSLFCAKLKCDSNYCSGYSHKMHMFSVRPNLLSLTRRPPSHFLL